MYFKHLTIQKDHMFVKMDEMLRGVTSIVSIIVYISGSILYKTILSQPIRECKT